MVTAAATAMTIRRKIKIAGVDAVTAQRHDYSSSSSGCMPQGRIITFQLVRVVAMRVSGNEKLKTPRDSSSIKGGADGHSNAALHSLHA